MNKIYKVIYSKVKQCYIVVSELAKSHVKSSHGSNGQQKAALTMSVLLALGAFTFAFGPVNAEAATSTEGKDFIGVEHDTSEEDASSANYQGGIGNHNQGAKGANSITIGVNAEAGEGTIAIGDRRASVSKGSVYVGQGDIAKPKSDTGAWVTSVGYNSDATGYGSIAIGSNAIAKNSYDKDANGDAIQYSETYTGTDNKTHIVLNANPGIQRASVALGYGASADNGNIAIGSYSDASTDLRTNSTEAYKTDTTADSYVSVGTSSALRRISNVADGAADTDVATVAQLKKVADTKAGSWKLTAGSKNSTTVDATNNTVNFSAGSDNNLSVSKAADSNNVTIGLNKDVNLGATTSGNGGSLSVYQDPSSAEKENNNDQLGSHVRIDGSTVSIRYQNGTKDSDARGVVLGVAKDSSNPLGYMYLADGNQYYYVHGTMASDPKALQGRLVYNSSQTGYNYIANLDDGISFSGDTVKASSSTKNTTADTRLDPTAANHTLSIKGGVTDTDKLTSGNIGVVTTPTEYDGTLNNGVKTAGGLTIQLAKELKDLSSAEYTSSETNGEGDQKETTTYTTTVNDKGLSIKTTTKGKDTSKTVTGPSITKDGINAGEETITNVDSGFGKDDKGNYYNSYDKDKNGTNAANLNDVNKMITDATASGGTIGNELYKKANVDATNIGTNLSKVPVKNADGTFQYEKSGAIKLRDATNDDKTANENDWGKAIGTGKIANPAEVKDDNNQVTNDPTKNGSQQLVTGGTVYSEVRPEDGKYVKKAQTTAANLNALDTQLSDIDDSSVKYDTKDDKTVDKTKITLAGGTAGTTITNVKSALDGVKDTDGNAATVATAPTSSLTNAVNLGDLQTAYNTLDTKVNNNKTKYYSVNDQVPNIFKSAAEEYAQYLNADNKGAKEFAGQAAGYMTYTSGIASTVGGSFSGILNEAATPGSNDFRGAAALSYGTFNINDNTSASQPFSGVANSIVGQANMTTDSNAAIIVGAGNSVTNSYRAIDLQSASAIMQNLKDPQKLNEALKTAVPKSGAQVMVMGGGNSADNAYMTQIVGVGNTVKGTNTDDKGTTKSEYDESASTQYNYVDGFQNTLTNGKNDYIIGSNNTITGSSVDTNKSNLVLGDNHKLTDKKNNVILGSADDKDTVTDASEAVIIGHNANVSVDGGVALGNGSVAAADANAEGYDPTSTAENKASTDTSATWKSTTGAVSIGANGTTTRKITNVAAGFSDTDAVNVAQLKKLGEKLSSDSTTALKDKANVAADNIGANLKGSDGKTAASTDEIRANEDAWAAAIGTGKVADSKATDAATNGSKQLVTGGEVYSALHGGLDNITVGKDGKDGTPGKDGSIGIVGQTGAKGEDGKNAFATTIIKTERGVDGVDGKNGKDGITRVVYQDGTTKRTFATLDDGLKFAGDDGQKDSKKVIAKKLDEQLDIVGGADSTKLTDNNIGVNSTTDGKLKIQLAQNLAGITSIANQTTTNGKTTGAKITLNTDGSTDFNGGKITNIASNATKGADGKYTVADADKNNAASMSDVQNLIKDATDSADAGLAEKANIKADNIGANLKGSDGKTAASTDEIRANEDAWAAAIGTGKVADSKATDAATNGSKQLVTGGEVYSALHGGLDNITVGKDGKDGTPGKDGSIGIVGQTGAKGEDGKNAFATTIIKTERGVDGVDGKNGKDGITRVVYQDGTTKRTFATLDDGLKFAGDDGQKDSKKVIAKKLDEQLDIVGGADSTKLTDNNIGVNSTTDGKLKIQLAKELTDITSISGSTDTNGAKITLDAADKDINVNNGKITNLTAGTADNDAATVKQVNDVDAKANANSEAIKTNASNIEKNGKAIEQNSAAIKTNASNIEKNGKAIEQNSTAIKTNADNIEKNSKAIEQNSAAIKTNADNIEKNSKAIEQNSAAIKTNADNIEKNSKAIEQNSAAIKTNADNIEKNGKAIEQNSAAIKTNSSNIEKITKTVEQTSAQVATNSSNIEKNGKAIEQNSAAIKTNSGNIEKNTAAIESLGQNKANIDALNIGKNLKGADGKAASADAIKANEDAWGDAIGTGKVESGNKQLVTGDTVYNELRPTADGFYIKKGQTTAKNLSSLDTQVKATHDLINSDGTTIKIGGSDTATKIDVSGKDSSGNTTSRVITGVKTDTSDATSAASVGYVNDMNAANTQQIYHDMNSAYSHVENDISRAAAGSNALAALHPMEFDPDDKAQYALGYGHYRNSNAGAVGVFYQPDENSLFSIGASFGNGDAGINAGVTVKFGPGGSGHHALTKTQMAKVINEQSKEIDTLKKENADKDKRIDALEQKVNEILAKVEKDKA